MPEMLKSLLTPRANYLVSRPMQTTAAPPDFDACFRENLTRLFEWRRDVRRFRVEKVPEAMIDHLLDLAQLSPSVGNSQPWRWVRVESERAREKIRFNFAHCNADALASLGDERARTYAKLKLAGLERAPVQFAVFCDAATAQGHGLGQRTMPEMLDYSVVSAVMTFWLAARAQGLGVGWVSILDPAKAAADLDVPEGWRLIAYFCVGYPEEEHEDPELVRFDWQARTRLGRVVLER